MKRQLLEYYMHDGMTAFRFELKGIVDAEGSRQLERAWRAAASIIGDRTLSAGIPSSAGRMPVDDASYLNSSSSRNTGPDLWVHIDSPARRRGVRMSKLRQEFRTDGRSAGCF